MTMSPSGADKNHPEREGAVQSDTSVDPAEAHAVDSSPTSTPAGPQPSSILGRVASIAASGWFFLLPVITAGLLIWSWMATGFSLDLALRFVGLIFAFGSGFAAIRKQRRGVILTKIEELSIGGGVLVAVALFASELYRLMT